MPSEITVPYTAGKGQVSLSISSGLATQGRYSINATNGFDTINIGSGSLSDNIEDKFAIPIADGELDDWTVVIRANYTPAQGHTQVSVDYKFTQQGAEMHTEEIRSNAGPLATHHECTFTKK